MSLSKQLSKQYYNPKEVGSFAGLSSFKREKKLNKKNIKKWLLYQDAYTLHKTPRKKFPRRKTIVSGINAQWQGDLICLPHLKKHNRGYVFIFTVIDVFSKVAYAIPLKNKTGLTLVKALKSIFKKSHQKPKKFQTDKGSEFLNKTFQTYLKKEKIHFFVTQNEDIKAAIVERFNRTLKERLWRYFTSRNTLHYLDVLDDLVNSYNNTYHRSIKRSPASVNQANQQEVWLELYGDPIKIKQPSYKVGDRVRLSKARAIFKKGYLPSWTEEIFTISKVIKTNPITYKVVDTQNEPLKGSFYKEELQKILLPKNKVYKIEKVLDKKGKGKKKVLLVKWRGYPDSHNSWVPAHQIKQI